MLSKWGMISGDGREKQAKRSGEENKRKKRKKKWRESEESEREERIKMKFKIVFLEFIMH